ncbi:MAG: GbsR/MarR family transcriptional regulator [Bacteroidales bacterium]
MPNITERSAYVEESGIFFETLGMTRMAGRIIGHLMVTDKEMVSFDELTQVLKASKSSISTNVKLCINVQFVKPVTTPGDRKTYFMLAPEISWVETFQRRMEQMNAMQKFLQKGLNLRSNQDDKPAQWIKDARDFYGWIIRELPDLLKKWERYQNNKKS